VAKLKENLEDNQDTIEKLEQQRNKRLTLEDLQLNTNEQLTLKSCDKPYRHALYKSMLFHSLTAYPECCRNTAVLMRNELMKKTYTIKNHVSSIDDTAESIESERTKKYFTTRNVNT